MVVADGPSDTSMGERPMWTADEFLSANVRSDGCRQFRSIDY